MNTKCTFPEEHKRYFQMLTLSSQYFYEGYSSRRENNYTIEHKMLTY